MYQLTQVSERSNVRVFGGSVPQSWSVCSVMFHVGHSWFRLSVGVWEDRAVLARLKQKLQTEDGRLILRIEQEEWKVTGNWK